MSDDFLAEARKRGFKAMAATAVIGLIAGCISRLNFVGHRTNEQIMASYWGFVAFLCMGMGIYGIVTAKQQIRPFRLVGAIFLFTGGLMWVIPFPH